MKRLTGAVAAIVVLVLIGLGLTAQSGQATQATAANDPVQPTPGYYQGTDNHHRAITFQFDGREIHHFHVLHLSLGGAHVNHHESAWHRTCHNGLCTNGRWLSPNQVHGSWGPANADHHYSWHAHWRYDH